MFSSKCRIVQIEARCHWRYYLGPFRSNAKLLMSQNYSLRALDAETDNLKAQRLRPNHVAQVLPFNNLKDVLMYSVNNTKTEKSTLPTANTGSALTRVLLRASHHVRRVPFRSVHFLWNSSWRFVFSSTAEGTRRETLLQQLRSSRLPLPQRNQARITFGSPARGVWLHLHQH